MSELILDFYKHPDELYTRGITFLDRLPTGATLSSAEIVEAIDLLDGSSAASVVGTPVASGTTLGVVFQNGTDGHDYLISVNVTLSNSAVLNSLVRMRVRSRLA